MSALIPRTPDPRGEEVQILGVFRASSLNAYDPELDARPVEVSLSFHNEIPAYFLVSITYLRDMTHNRQACEAMGKCWGFQNLEEARGRFQELRELADELAAERELWAEERTEEGADADYEDDEEGMFRLSKHEFSEPRVRQVWVYHQPPEPAPTAPPSAATQSQNDEKPHSKTPQAEPSEADDSWYRQHRVDPREFSQFYQKHFAGPGRAADPYEVTAVPDRDPSYSFFSFGN